MKNASSAPTHSASGTKYGVKPVPYVGTLPLRRVASSTALDIMSSFFVRSVVP